MKMAVVGCEASGKTVFMCALADYYGRDAANNPLRLKLTPENSAANNFERFQFRQMRCLHQWPPATPPDRTIEIKWSLRFAGKPVAMVDLMEFGGETFRAAFRDTEKTDLKDGSIAELLKYLGDTDFFVVLVSIKSLLLEPNDTTEQDFDRETEALWVTRGILDFIRTKRPNAGVVIGLTQADKYRNELGEAGGPAALFSARWPSVASAMGDIPIVEVASVSKTDLEGNPIDGYHTHGILPVMRAFSKYCFGNENALENGECIGNARKTGGKGKGFGRLVGLLALFAALVAAAYVFVGKPKTSQPVLVEKVVEKVVETVVTNTVNKVIEQQVQVEIPVTNVIEKVVQVEVPVTNTIEQIVQVEVPVTNTIEQIVHVEVPVTNTIEQIVHVEVPVTNTIEQVVHVEVPVTNTIEQVVQVEVPVTNIIEQVVQIEVPVTNVVEQVVTNIVEKVVEKQVEVAPLPATQPVTTVNAPTNVVSDEELQKEVPPGFRIWTDYNGRKIIAKWTGVAVDESGITIVTRFNRRIDAVLWKFSAEDQAFIKAEIKRHKDKGEFMSDGLWVANPMFKK